MLVSVLFAHLPNYKKGILARCLLPWCFILFVSCKGTSLFCFCLFACLLVFIFVLFCFVFVWVSEIDFVSPLNLTIWIRCFTLYILLWVILEHTTQYKQSVIVTWINISNALLCSLCSDAWRCVAPLAVKRSVYVYLEFVDIYKVWCCKYWFKLLCPFKAILEWLMGLCLISK